MFVIRRIVIKCHPEVWHNWPFPISLAQYPPTCQRDIDSYQNTSAVIFAELMPICACFLSNNIMQRYSFAENHNERVVCVRNLAPEDIMLQASRLRCSLGRKVVKLRTRHVTKRPSVQGTWTTELKMWVEVIGRTATVSQKLFQIYRKNFVLLSDLPFVSSYSLILFSFCLSHNLIIICKLGEILVSVRRHI
jgi:hypothetical protein